MEEPMRQLPLLSALMSVVLATPAGAVDVHDDFSDLRIGYTLVDDSYEGTIDDGASRRDFEEDWDESHRAWALWLWSPGLKPLGLLAGVSAVSAFRDTDSSDTDVEIEYDAWAGHLNLGLGFAFNDQVQIEVVPFIGFGSARFKRILPGGTSTSDNETLIEYGANVNLPITFDHFQIGPQVGYLISDTSQGIRNGAGDEVDYDFKQGVFLFSAFLGYRF
jgi:hypothetical protein